MAEKKGKYMKGIILAGGSGTRMYPLTLIASKQLLPVYDKPMIFYSLSTLMLAGIREILIISTPADLPNFRRLLGDGRNLGVSFAYKEQPRPEGLAQAFVLGEDFIKGEPCAMILGDNIFYGNGLSEILAEAAANSGTAASYGRATVFGYYVDDPHRFGVVAFDEAQGVNSLRVTSIEEKPAQPKSNYAVTGLYFYDSRAAAFAKTLKPSARGELEITDLNRIYLEKGLLDVRILGRGYAWMDAGTMDSLLEASIFVQMLEKRQGITLSAPEEIAWRYRWITTEQLLACAEIYGNSPYGVHLKNVAEGRVRK
jgi:glucose-1-phosphate thymidylyltransferase